MGNRKQKGLENAKPTDMPPAFAADWILATTRLKNPEQVHLSDSVRERWIRDIKQFYATNDLYY